MVSYAFYTEQYLGSVIGQKAFDALAQRAAAQLSRLKRTYQVRGESVAEDMAVCAIAEVLCTADRNAGLRAASIGGVSVSYRDERCLSRDIYRAASTYLDIYRGVAQ